MPSDRILVVEDDPAIREGLIEKLTMEGYSVTEAADGAAAIERLEDAPHDLVVLDLMLPRVDGLSVLRWLRARDTSLPVLILSAKGQEVDKIGGLRTGADDYLAKPFGLGELSARIVALLRRARGGRNECTFGAVTVDAERRKVFRGGVEVAMSRKELDVLLFLVRNRGRIVTREQILSGAWGYTAASSERSVDFHMLNLRKKLEDDPKSPRHLITRHGLGFLLA